jgi:CheY-like chemotaxis protein
MDTQPQKRIRVLVVDDEKIWREMLCDLLDPSLYDVITADSYDEAVRILRERAFLVIVTDQRLVDEDEENIQGIQLLDEVERMGDGTQVIVVTGYPRIEFARKALLRRGHKAYDYLLKRPEGGGPFSIRDYRQLVKDAAGEARLERHKIVLQPFSGLPRGVSPVRVARTLSGEIETTPVSIEKALNRLLNSLKPLLPLKVKAWLLESSHSFELLYWSRENGKAALVSMRAKQSRPIVKSREWMKAAWRLVQNEEFSSDSVAGISYFVEGMGFDDFEALFPVKEDSHDDKANVEDTRDRG